jgi:Bacterial Ig-like domain
VARYGAGGANGVKRALVLLAVVLTAVAAVQGSQATFTASAQNAASTFTTATDYIAPAVTLTTPAAGATINSTTPTLSGAAGNATGDATTVTVKIYSGSSATGTPVQTKTPSRSGATWTTTASTLTAGTYTAQATQTDTGGNTGTSTANTFMVDTTKPTATRVVATNKTGGTAGKIQSGDTVTFTYSEAIDPTSVWSGWNGASTTVRVRFTDSGSNDSFTVLDSSSGTTVKLGSVTTSGNYVSSSTTFDSTMLRSADGASIIVTLGTPTSVQATAVTARNMAWTVGAGIKDVAGNTITTPATWTETDNDVDF